MTGEASAKARLFRLAEKASTIQCGYKKWGTRARVFSQTLANENNKNQIRKINGRRYEERSEYGK